MASASTGSVAGGVLTYTATANENNDFLIWPTSATPGAITLDDFGTAPLVAGAAHRSMGWPTTGQRQSRRTDVENVIGGSGKDTITGSKFVNVITGGLGADKLIGGSGNDTFYAKDGVKDTLDGGTGTDSAQADRSDVRTSIEKTIK